MRPFKYTGASNMQEAIGVLAANTNAKYLAGGTNLLDLMKEDVERPTELVDINRLGNDKIKAVLVGTQVGISLGSLCSNTATANHPLVRKNFPLLSQAILAGASAQIRNMATNGGNLNQRTRCSYFYDIAMACNKREPGTGCSAIEGVNRMHAIFSWSDKCVAVMPSDMCVALAALDAVVIVQALNGTQRRIPFSEYHRLPGDQPQLDNTLAFGEMVTAIEIPKNNFATKSYYLKVRDRSSYAFALVSVAAGLETAGTTIKKANIAMGGVAHKPWRVTEAEDFLKGKEGTTDNFKNAAELAMQKAMPLEHNAFKVELGKRAIARALMQAMNGGQG